MSTTALRAPTGTAPVSGSRWPPAERATHSWRRGSTGSPRSLPDARDILDELTKRHVKLSLGGSIHATTDPVGRLLFDVLAMVAEFETDLIWMRTGRG